jgi:hypothetical protein
MAETKNSGRKLAYHLILPPDEDSGGANVEYFAGDVPAPQHAETLGEHVWAPEEQDDDEDGNAALRASSVPLRLALDRAKELGLTPGNGLPRNPSIDLVHRAIRFKEGRSTSAEPAGSSEVENDVSNEDGVTPERVDGRTKAGRAAKAGDNDAGSRS